MHNPKQIKRSSPAEAPTKYAVIGDLVQSRKGKREQTQAALMDGLEKVTTPSIEVFHPTVGDEIQGIFASLGNAFQALHFLRVQMRILNTDIRFGIGIGEIKEIAQAPSIQDGSAWWNARSAIETVHEMQGTPGRAGVRTGIIGFEENGFETITATLVSASAQLIDSQISSLKPSTCGSLLGLLIGEPNYVTAEKLSISAPANSQRVNTNNLRPLADAMRALWEL
ncbi:SatD family protein [Arcanobacterium ihumii]|uniref:SatD family protein n=1 Tax=Arcanobacterium ihumii TaxID=2138162 RepID=UPI000F5311CB|nr:SatD family protein [Arcanobacterium ihumii]